MNTHAAPTPATASTPQHVVAIGASAGGLEALGSFFQNLPDPGPLAFVVIQHLSPDHRSYMVDLLQKHTRLHVQEALDGQELRSGEIYHIPPGRVLSIAEGRLRIQPQGGRRTLPQPIDQFFISLAQAWGDKAIGIILSGTGSDGTAGARAIKAAGGAVFVQDPGTAKFDGMPRSAIEHDVADIVLPAERIGGHLVKCTQARPTSIAGCAEGETEPKEELPAEPLQRIARILADRTGVDFSGYKESTILRRIERRMHLRHLEDLEGYVALLRQDHNEVDILRRELLIGVTQFLRDEDAFEILAREVVPAIVSANQGSREIRVWVAGCATGEEAYSLAILFHEHINAAGQHFRIKIFATDLDRAALDRASSGRYPIGVLADIGRQRYDRYFIKHEDGVQVVPELREMVVFAQHDVVNDPPFTRMDLTCCRNLLIYLKQPVQERVLALLRFSLKPSGFLFLGASESPGAQGEHLQVVNGRWRIYRALGPHRPASELMPAHPVARFRFPEPPRPRPRATPPEQTLELAQQRILRDLGVRCFVVDRDGQLLHSFGDVQPLLQIASGPLDTRLDQLLARPLGLALAGALPEAARERREVTVTAVAHAEQCCDLRVRPLAADGGPDAGFLVFVLQMKPAEAQPGVTFAVDEVAERRIAALEEKLNHSQASLQTTIEELESSNEELQATNEELVSANEELQSTNEELQSLNEELYTVNNELQVRVAEVSLANSDMGNLLAGSNTATLFLEQSLTIRRFTPGASQVLNLIDRDVGRPLVHIALPFVGIDLLALCAQTAMDGQERRTEATHRDGRIFLIGLLPYRDARGKDNGVVVTLNDITEMRRSIDALRASESRHRAFFDLLGDGMVVAYGPDLKVSYAAGRGHADLGFEPEGMQGVDLAERFIGIGGPAVVDRLREVFAGRTAGFLVRVQGRELLVSAVPVLGSGGEPAYGVAFLQDVTGSRHGMAEAAERGAG